MPELAEVQTVRDVLKSKILNQTITNIEIIYPKMIETDLMEFKNNLIGEEFIDIKRRGKYLIFETNNNYLISHLRMEGKYFIKSHLDLIDKHEHIIFEFEDFDLRYHDTRKFGRMALVKKNELDDYLSNVGPDANSDVDLNYLYNKLHNKKLPIKTLLLDQSIIAGLGNIYVDEVLYESKLNPFEKGCDITKEDVQKIINASKKILNKAIEYKGTTIRSYTSSLNVTGGYQKYLKVHTKDGLKCDCGVAIIKDRVGGRSTYFCPNCQRLK